MLAACGQTTSTDNSGASQESSNENASDALAITDTQVPDIDLSAYDNHTISDQPDQIIS